MCLEPFTAGVTHHVRVEAELAKESMDVSNKSNKDGTCWHLTSFILDHPMTFLKPRWMLLYDVPVWTVFPTQNQIWLANQRSWEACDAAANISWPSPEASARRGTEQVWT